MVPFGASSRPPASKEGGGPIPIREGARAKSAVRSPIPTGLAYLLAVGLTAAILLLRLALSSRFGDHPGLEVFLIPIVLSALAGGLGPGLVSTALAGIATDYFLLPPKHSLAIQSGLHSVEWLVLIVAGTLMSVLLRKRSRGFPGAAAYSFSNERPEMSSDSESSVSRTILISAGSTCAALGAVTLVGWFFHISALTRVAPAFNPMMANTAVGLFLDGLALLFLAAGWPKAALGGAVWSLLAGILTLAEFSFSINLHIDELLVRDYLRVLPASPGRPAPNAALCLVFCGVALLWASMPRWREKAAVIIGVLGAVVFALGAAAVSGYVVGLPMYALGDSKPMAANAGLGFVAMGLAVMALAWRRSQPSPEAEGRILLSAERKVRAGFALALAALILIGGTSYFSLVRLHEDRVSVDHTYQVIVALRLVLSTITDAETGERGFIITGQEGFLQPYQKAASSVRADLGSLRRLTADNRMQQGRLDELQPLVAERLLLLQQAVEARRGTGFPAAQPIVATGRGKQIHDRIRDILAEMEASEQTLLQERAARARHAGRVARTVIVAGITLAFVFVVVALFVISADFAGSRRARAALQDARDQLETRVLQRTAEVAKVQQAALGSEARLAGIIGSAMDAILTVDEQQRIVLFNPAAEKMFGCGAADALGQPLDRFMPERFRSAHLQHHHAFGEAGVTQRQMGKLGSLCGLRASGEEFPIEAAISRVDVEGQKLFTAILRDITERVAAEEALRSSEARFRSLVENSADAIAMQDAEGKILYASSPVERILGYRPEEFVGHNVLEFIHPEEREQFEAVRRSLPESLQPVLTRFRTRHKDGSWRVVESIRSNQLDNPDVRSVVVNFRDVTEAVSIAETLRRQAALFNQTYDAVMVWNWGGPITFWNRGAERLYGYNLREVIGKNPHQLLRTETPGGVEGFLSVLEQTNTWEGAAEHVTRDGRKIIVESRMTLVRDEDQVYVLEANRDITERRRAEEALQESEGRLRALVNASSDAVYRMSSDWSEMRQLDGRRFIADTTAPTRDWLGVYIHPEDEALVTRTIQNAIRDKSVFELEHRVRHTDGSFGWTLSRAVPRLDAKGEIIEWFGMASDVTRRKSAEEALRENHARLKKVLEVETLGVLFWDLTSGRMVEANDTFLNLMGYSRSDVEAGDLTWQKFTPPEYLEVSRAELRKFAASGRVGPYEKEYFRKDGSRQWFVFAGSSLGGNSCVEFCLDISDRKKAEEETRESRARLEVALASMTDAVFISDTQGRFLDFNEGFATFHKFKSKSECAKTLAEYLEFLDVFLENGQPAPLERWPVPRALRGESDTNAEYTLRRKDTGETWAGSFSFAPIRDKNGIVSGSVVVARDTTERKRAQEEIRLLNEDLERRVAQRTAELEAANKELESFSYSVAHDLRAPLRAVDGFSDALLEDYGPQLPQEARKYVQTIRGGAQRMGCLIDDLLAFSRLGRQPLTKQPVDMDVLVLGVLEDVVPEGREKNIEIVNGNLPAAQGDPGLLRQVWANLLSNAIKYSRHAEQARIEIGALEEAQGDVYFVRDNGAGFDMKYADKLFGVFQRLHRADEFEGTGIGLAIVQRVVHRHGGRVWAEAKLNEGATFYFTLEGGT